MHRLKKTIKLCVAYILYYSGILYLLCIIKLRNRAVVLTYHRVIAPERMPQCHSSAGIIVSQASFEKQLPVIRRFLNPLSVAQFQEYLEKGELLPNRSCLITFDDGWIDNFETAYPLLQKYGVPAVIFLPYDYISNASVFWQEELMQRLSHMIDNDNQHDTDSVASLVGTNVVPSSAALRDYISSLKHLGYDEINKIVYLVRDMTKDSTKYDHYDRYMTWEQILEMQDSIISFGSHSMSHRILTKLSSEECMQELEESKKGLGSRLKKPVLTLAYPNGDYNTHVEQLAALAGYKLAFTTRSGYVDSQTPTLAIPRINIHNGSSYNKAVFLCTILNIF